MDRGMAQPEWNTPQTLRHFSIVRKLDGRPFPPGKTSGMHETDRTEQTQTVPLLPGCRVSVGVCLSWCH